MERVPEPELMLDPEQAREYARADFAEPHEHFVALAREACPDLPAGGVALDLGCGPGDVTLRWLRAYPGWEVDAVDGSPAMLAFARRAAEEAGIEARVHFVEAVLPELAPRRAPYDLVLSNSLLHHLHRPSVLWEAARRFGRPGGDVFVMDLMRPDSAEAARGLMDRYARGEPEGLRRDFLHSLHAAFRPDEVRAQLAAAGLGALAVEVVSDRHLVVRGRLPSSSDSP